MKTTRFLPLLVLLPAALYAAEKSIPTEKNCGCECCKGKEVCCCHEPAAADQTAGAAKKSAATTRYPLRGVITDIFAGRSALLVKHEAIPGYMPAMTMLFKVEAATLKAAKKNQTITGTLVRRDGEFWLEDVQPAAKPRS